jgi:hypothetical protein
MVAHAQTNLLSAATGATNALRDIKPPLAIASPWEPLLWSLAILLLFLLIVGGIVAFLLWKFRRRPAPPMIPAHVRARQQLEAALAWLHQPKPFVIAISDTLRSYLEERFNFRAPDRTTEEFLLDLQRTSLLDHSQKDSLGDFLQRCDLVKFARYEPTETELRQLHAAALQLVLDTEPIPNSDTAPPAAQSA